MSQEIKTRDHSPKSWLRKLIIPSVASLAVTQAGMVFAETALTFQLDWVKNHQYAGMYIAEEKGYYSDAGFTVELLSGGDVSNTAAVIAGGGAEIGFVSNMGRMVDAVNTGADLVAVGALLQQSPAGILTRPDDVITEAAQLAGRRIGADEAGIRDINALFTINGLDPDWTDVRTGYDAAPLLDGQVDAYYGYVTNQPIPYRLKGVDIKAITFSDLGSPSYAGLFVTTRAFLEENRDTVVAFMNATAKGFADANSDPQAAATLTIDKYGLELGLQEDITLEALKAQNALMVGEYTGKNGLFAMDMGLISGDMYNALRAAGRDNLPDPATVFDTSIVAANPVPAQ